MPIITSLNLNANAFMTVKIPKSLGIKDDTDVNVKWDTLYWKDEDGAYQEYKLTEFEEGYDYEIEAKRPEVEVGDTTDSEDEDDDDACACGQDNEDRLVGCCRDGDCPDKIEQLCSNCGTWDEKTQQWSCDGCKTKVEPKKEPKKDTSKEEPNICLFCDDVNDRYPLQCKNCKKYPCCEDGTAQCMTESYGTYGCHNIPLCVDHKIKNGFGDNEEEGCDNCSKSSGEVFYCNVCGIDKTVSIG